MAKDQGQKPRRSGRICSRIARDQMERPRSFEERDAIAHFWGLIDELAAAYTSSENPGHAAKVLCCRATALLSHETEVRAESEKPRRRKKKRSGRREGQMRKPKPRRATAGVSLILRHRREADAFETG